MTKAERARQARRQLDAKYAKGLTTVLATRPPHGWVRAVRDALGMNSRQLAARMGVTQGTIAKLERSEANDRVQLDSLRRAAAALDCELIYALVPRESLDQTVRNRAQQLAKRDLAAVDRTMRLERQGLDSVELQQRIDEYAERLVVEGRIWDEDDRN